MPKTLIIFDIDGTLLYSNKVDSECFAQTYEAQFGKPFPTIDWREYPHVTDHTIFNTVIEQHFGRSATPEDIERQQHHFVALLKQRRGEAPDEFREVPGAKSAVSRLLGNRKFAVGIATGGWRKPALLKLNHLGFPVAQFHASFADDKFTREDILSESIDKARSEHADIKRIVYIGDAVWDVQTTRNMHLDFVGVRLRGDLEVLKKEGAGTVVQNFVDYNLFLESIRNAKPPD
jgi:phosphoglycolate phosphatase-like HAD superfamily hydrolase